MTLPDVLPVLRDARWPGWQGCFGLPWPRNTSPFTPRIGFQRPDGSLLDGSTVVDVLPDILLEHALDTLGRRPAEWRVTAHSAGLLGLGKRPVVWELVDEFAVERMLLPGFSESVVALAGDAVTLLAPARGRLTLTTPRAERREQLMAAAARAYGEAGAEAVSPAPFWARRGVRGVGITGVPYEPRFDRTSLERHGHDGMETNLAAATLLRLLVARLLDASEARLIWPRAPLAVPQAEGYLDYFERGLDGRGLRDPAFERDQILGLAALLVREAAAQTGKPARAPARGTAAKAEPPHATPPTADIALPFPVMHPLAVEHVAAQLGLKPEEIDSVRFGGAYLVEAALPYARAGYVEVSEQLRFSENQSALVGSAALFAALRARGMDTTPLELRSLFVPKLEGSWHGLRHLYASVSDRVGRFRHPVSASEQANLSVALERSIEALFANGRAGRLETCRKDPSEAPTLHRMSESNAARPGGDDACTSLLDVLAYFEPRLDLEKHLLSGEPVRPSRLSFYTLTHPIVRALGLRLVDEAPWPETMDAAVDLLIEQLSVDDRAHVRGMARGDLIRLHPTWGMGIRNGLGLWQGNHALLASCGAAEPDACSQHLIEAVWARLRASDPETQ